MKPPFEIPYTRVEIAATLRAEVGAVHDFFAEIEEERFFEGEDGVWSPAENLVHLIKSASPVVQALRAPKMVLRAQFGKAKHVSRSLPEVRHTYVDEALAGGGVATGGFLPQVTEETAAERARILDKWQSKNEQLLVGMESWSEEQLDTYQLPHPLLGNMTVREILLFTVYHNLHHVNDVQRLLGMEEEDWLPS
ncbi:MAG TPA: DinB family protein [Anaerolineae bacterium]|nr:DinB family protein [Anaerolineae bacterium]